MAMKAGEIFVELVARTERMEAALRRMGVLSQQTKDKIAKDAKDASKAVSGMGATGGAAAAYSASNPFNAPDGKQYASLRDWAMGRPMTPGASTSSASASAATSTQAHATEVGVFAGLRRFFGGGRGGGGGGGIGGGGGVADDVKPSGSASMSGSRGFFGGAVAGGLMTGAAIEGARQYWRAWKQAGEAASPLLQEYAVGGREFQRRISYEDRDIDPTGRVERLQKRYDDLAGELGSRQRNVRAGSTTADLLGHYANYGFMSLFRSRDSLQEQMDTVAEELRSYSQQNTAQRIRQRERNRRVFLLDQQESQATGRFGIEDLVLSMQQTAANTELLNQIVTRIQR